MPYRGKPSKNCADCRRRKIKCDLKVPGCTQCSNAGLECSGYRNQLDLMFLDENERTERSVMKRSKGSSRKTPSDTSSAPSRRSSPTPTAIIDTPVTSRNASLPSSIQRRSPSVGPPRSTRASDRRTSRTTTPEEGGARSRGASKAALRRTLSAQQSRSGGFLQPFDSSQHIPQQQKQQPQHHFQEQRMSTNTSANLGRGHDLGFDTGSTSNMGTPYSQGSSNASVPSINIPLHFDNMHLSAPHSLGLPISQSPMSFSMPASGAIYNPSPNFLLHQQQHHYQHHHQPQRATTFLPNTAYEQEWDCGEWVHDIRPAQYTGTGMLTPQLPLPSDEEWLGWQWAENPQQQQQHHQQR